MKKVVTLGEIMLRLSPEGRKRFLQVDRLDVNYGGSEANVAVALCNMGCPAEFVTALPENDLGRAAENFVRSFGVSTAHCVKKQGRLGVYYLEKGAAQRPSKVIYDREGSVFSKAESADFDFDEIFDGAGWFHFSGITPALSPSAAELTVKAVESAKKKGLTVSCDLNYRSALWSVEKASKTLAPLLYQTDVLIANENHLKMLFGIGEGGNLTCAESAAAAAEKFGLSQSVMTVRRTLSADDNNFSAVLYEKGRHFRSKNTVCTLSTGSAGETASPPGLFSETSRAFRLRIRWNSPPRPAALNIRLRATPGFSPSERFSPLREGCPTAVFKDK